MSKENQVPVTGSMLSLIKALQSARTLYICESAMAEELHLPPPSNHADRLKQLFAAYRPHLDAMGLHSNQQTFEALLRVKVPEDAWHMVFEELPKRYAFDPWAGMGYGGIIELAHSANVAKSSASASPGM